MTARAPSSLVVSALLALSLLRPATARAEDERIPDPRVRAAFDALLSDDLVARYAAETVILDAGPRTVRGWSESESEKGRLYSSLVACINVPLDVVADPAARARRLVDLERLGFGAAVEGVSFYRTDPGDGATHLAPIAALRGRHLYRVTLGNVGHFIRPRNSAEAERLVRALVPDGTPVSAERFDRALEVARRHSLPVLELGEPTQYSVWTGYTLRERPPVFGVASEASARGLSVRLLAYLDGGPIQLVTCLFTPSGCTFVERTTYVQGLVTRWSVEVDSDDEEEDDEKPARSDVKGREYLDRALAFQREIREIFEKK